VAIKQKYRGSEIKKRGKYIRKERNETKQNKTNGKRQINMRKL
jgi:hypothetical protein